MEITLQLPYVLIQHCNIFFITSQLVTYLFVAATVFDDVKFTLYFSTFELRTEITL